jgi:predicted TIM-barrel fold metal-dependent hydrolase
VNNHNINVIALLLLAGLITSAGAKPIGEKAAMELPIIDTHFHAMPFMTPSELLTRMDKDNILKIGGAHTSQKPRNDEFVNVMGDRYIRAEGGQMLTAGKKGGPGALEDADSSLFQASFNNLKRAVSNYKVHVISEIFVNTTSSAGEEWRRWKIKGDSSGMHALFDLATDNKIPMLVHAQLQGEEGLADELSRLAASRPDGMLVMGHCGKDTTADTMRQFLNKTPNAVCNLAYRSPPQEQSSDEDRRIWSSSGIKEEWRQLIEDMPDRFMVGIDDVKDWDEFHEVVETIRKDLLANLTRSTAEKVSYQNAKRIYNF